MQKWREVSSRLLAAAVPRLPGGLSKGRGDMSPAMGRSRPHLGLCFCLLPPVSSPSLFRAVRSHRRLQF